MVLRQGMGETKRITILHSNDMHGDFLAEQGEASMLTGGLALLSGYVNRARREEENVIHVISGDMVQGSIIDSEFKGISTIEIMNYLAPDVVSLGNHEFDYGLPHLLFLEKMANFPIVNANLYIARYNKRLMKPFHVIRKAGFDILFIGIITDKILADLSREEQIASFISLAEASQEVGRIANAYRNDDIDLTVLLTHIGHESDLALAELLDPAWGVDLIIGGHSHTVLERPAKVNGVLIAQAGVGTDQVGRFDLTVDDDTNAIVDFQWKLVPINSDTAEPDQELRRYIDSFKQVVDRKYNTILCKLAEKLTHPSRLVETPLGNLTADAVANTIGCDVALVGSGSIRLKELGPLVTLGEFQACYPFKESLTRCLVDGSQLKMLFAHVMRPENRTGEGECYQVNGGVRAVYDDEARSLVSLSVGGKPAEDHRSYSLCLPAYHFRNSASFLSLTQDEISALARPKTVATSVQDVIEEYLRNNQNIARKVEGRLVYEVEEPFRTGGATQPLRGLGLSEGDLPAAAPSA